MIQGKGRSAKRKGTRAERQAVKELQRWFDRVRSELVARRVIGSGAFGGQDASLRSDVKIERGGRIVDRIEIKVADPNRKSGPITVAFMNAARQGRRLLMAKHDRGDFLTSAWLNVWEDLHKKAGRDIGFRMPVTTSATRGVTIGDIQRTLTANGGLLPLLWGGVVWMDVGYLAELLHGAHGEGKT